MKRLIKRLLNNIGYEIKKVNKNKPHPWDRPIGNMINLLEDLKLRGLFCTVIMDVGANRSHWSRMAKSVFSDAVVCLIEPQLEMKEDLVQFCKEYNDSFFVLAGAGARKEIKTLAIWDDLLGSSLLHDEPDLKERREIEIITIDDIINDNSIKIPDLIKLDIQGFELEALKGASQTWGKTEVFILEVSLFCFETMMPVFSDVVNFMLEKDYVVYDFPGFLRRPYDGALGQCDICFVKKNGFLRKSNQW
ncbi:MAG: FkbM family methyltransferase [Bacteroidetes bacterium]|nr:FkbM family methyltransferase [Bacteroidota bacterium]